MLDQRLLELVVLPRDVGLRVGPVEGDLVAQVLAGSLGPGLDGRPEGAGVALGDDGDGLACARTALAGS